MEMSDTDESSSMFLEEIDELNDTKSITVTFSVLLDLYSFFGSVMQSSSCIELELTLLLLLLLYLLLLLFLLLLLVVLFLEG